ncbi:MAG: hypothetical protein J7604_06255 [Sporocytophaga sp.]|uniref:hypothetical protein n=1 Tax=Sporocytophaga sp. TaxID=2231183 RepID=UPI001B11573C|nr:hypothetical protein [Sporocytophaga sp.]MBO9699794.1 hypothetical protein [Sporocytophaga sp.]
MEKKIQLYLYIFFVISNIVGFSGCHRKPEDVVKNYLDLTYIGSEPDDAYELISSEDQKLKTRELFIREINRKNYLKKKLPKNVRKQYKYEILRTEKKADTLIVFTKLYKPDAEEIMRELGFFMLNSISGNEEKMPDPENALFSLMEEKPVVVTSEEKIFKVVPEKNDYKICLNFSKKKSTKKNWVKNQKLEEKISKAIKELRFEEALSLLKIKDSAEGKHISKQVSDIQNIMQQTLMLGQTMKMGNLEITALSAQIRPVKFLLDHTPGEKSRELTSDEQYFILTCKIANQCNQEFFCPKEKLSLKGDISVQDNFGNQMHELAIPDGITTIDGNNYKSLRPGETRTMEFICEVPLVSQAERFLWKIKLNTDNRNTAMNAYVLVSKKEILRK